MYNVSSVSLQNIYAPSAAAKASSKKDDSAAIDTVFAPSATEKNAEADNSTVTADNLYDILAERAKTSAGKLAEYDFSDMYVRSTAHQFQLTESQRNAIRQAERSGVEYGGFYTYTDIRMQLSTREEKATIEAGCITVPIGAGELPQLMDDIMQGLSDGLSLVEILQNKQEEYKMKYHTPGYSSSNADLLSVNPANGDIVAVTSRGRVFDKYDERFTDEDAALELADDFATFLRYVAFAQEDDDPERVASLISYVKDKQAYANYDRYIFDLDMDESVDNNAMANLIIANLTAAGVLKSEDDEEEEEEAIDALMEAVKEHQETLREDMIDREKSELAIEEINEILAERAASIA